MHVQSDLERRMVLLQQENELLRRGVGLQGAGVDSGVRGWLGGLSRGLMGLVQPKFGQPGAPTAGCASTYPSSGWGVRCPWSANPLEVPTLALSPSPGVPNGIPTPAGHAHRRSDHRSGASAATGAFRRSGHRSSAATGAFRRSGHRPGAVTGQVTSQVPFTGQVTGRAQPQVPFTGQVTGQVQPQVPCTGQVTGQAQPQVSSLSQVTGQAQVPDAGQTQQPGSSGATPYDAMLSGIVQLQGLVAQIANKGGSSSGAASGTPEVVRPGVNEIARLPEATPEAALQFSDWVHAVRPSMSDLSDTSAVCWEKVMEEAREWCTRSYVPASPVQRLRLKLPASTVDAEQKWSRLKHRMEHLVLQACPEAVREELSAARISGLLHVLCRLHVIYKPGGLPERTEALRQVQSPKAAMARTRQHRPLWTVCPSYERFRPGLPTSWRQSCHK